MSPLAFRESLDSWRALFVVSVLGVCVACGPSPAPGGSGAESSSSGSTANGSSTTTLPTHLDTTVGVATGSGSESESGGSTGTSSGTGSSSGSGTTDAGGESSSSGGMGFVCPPGGGMACVSPAECPSNACYLIGPLGGVCSECSDDSDCAFGCSAGNPLTGDCALCCDGSLGCGCQTDLACQGGLSCASLVNIPGIIALSTCSECASDLDCAGGQLCSPEYDLAGLAGQRLCVAPGSQANGDGCEFSGSGDQQCTSGNCATTTLMGIPVAGFCSECDEDADCPGACLLPELVINGMGIDVLPGGCV